MPDYDYYGLMASTWDIWRDDTANWRDRVRSEDRLFCVLGERPATP